MHNTHGKKKTIWSSDTQRKNNDVNYKVTDDDATVTAWDSHIALTPLVWKLKSSAEFSAKLKINWKLVCQRAACFWSILGEKWKTFSRPRARNDWSVDLICTLRFKLKNCTLALACVHLKQWSKSNRLPINLHWFSISHSKVTILSVKLCRCQANASH